MLENPFWQYSLAHYSRQEVAESCLSLQDRNDANVNLILFCCWLGFRGERLERKELVEAQLVIGEWDKQVVQPLRQVHRYLKQSLQSTSKMLETASTLELTAERIVQDRLASWWLEGAVGVENQGETGTVVAELQQHNLAIYLALLNVPPPSIQSPLFWPLSASLSHP